MISCRTTLNLVLLAMLAVLAESSWGTCNGNSYNYDLSNMSDLRKLYNSEVFEAERLTRPLDGWSFQYRKFSHSGVRVTLDDDTQWLIHKGDGYGISSQTVVVDARHMSGKWKIVETKDFGGRKTVSDFVEAGGTDYRLMFDNCHHASCRMMDG
ncbi:hypothetical protein E1301_Tti006786 [Triplophysa tibetana]|uniref:Uncharacterized protein n=1 Tax=Triplophysa tibetana TaxID=1572043 RepID=A0A5A9N4F5_9TELE|nr:hypothetical protein E1301_Tti006786 [Triplophysa tibetana]